MDAKAKRMGEMRKEKLFPNLGIRTGKLVENVDHGMHAPELLNISTNNISRNDTANQLHHTICDTGHTEDGDYPVGYVPSVVGVIFGVLGKVPRLKMTPATDIDKQKDGGEETKNQDVS